MQSAIPYVVAGLASLAVIGGVAAFCHSVRGDVDRLLDERENNASRGQDEPVGLEVDSSMMWRISLADFLATFWFVWIPILLALCFGTAALFRKVSADTHSNLQ